MPKDDKATAYKLRRAELHLKTLHGRIVRFLEGKSHRITHDFESAPGLLNVRVQSLRRPPPTCSALIGEYLYNMRAALDYFACELVRRNNEVVNRRVEFPIFFERDDFRNPTSGKLTREVRKDIGLIHANHQAVIEDEQPFQGRHGNPEDDPLWLLHELSNYDRHQFLHPTSTITNESFHDFTPPELAERFKELTVIYGAFEPEAVVAIFKILPGPAIDVNVQTDIRFDVAFSDEGPCAGRPVIRTLADIGVRVGGIIKRLMAVKFRSTKMG